MLEKPGEETHWISIADMMSGLMMVFLFIAIAYMADMNTKRALVEREAIEHRDLQKELYAELTREFSADLRHWNAEIDPATLTVRFNEPDIYFDQGSDRLKAAYRDLLADFFPRYIDVLSRPEFRGEIAEIRIEGHTSSEAPPPSVIDKYIYNMRLSQDRTRAVLAYVLELNQSDSERDWLVQKLTANGLSSSRPAFRRGVEDRARSRRVEFRVRVDAESRMMRLLASVGT